LFEEMARPTRSRRAISSTLSNVEELAPVNWIGTSRMAGGMGVAEGVTLAEGERE